MVYYGFFKRVLSKHLILRGLEVPSYGGETEFSDPRFYYKNWKELFENIRKGDLERLICKHSIVCLRGLIPENIFSKEKKMN